MGIIMTTRELRPRQPQDFYPTPALLAYQMCKLAKPGRELILDPGCGEGVFGHAAASIYPDAVLHGIDVEPRYDGGVYDQYLVGDYLAHETGWRYDLIVGNPPYRMAEQFIRKSVSLLAANGEIIFLLRLNFLGSQGRMRGLWQECPPSYVYALGKRPSFTGDNRTDATEYAVYHWVKHCGAFVRRDGFVALGWLDWSREEV